ncbi:MAG: NADPH:quinone oxidoreductase family protein [Novosphingobium sp.]|nr:NADPH:quinone oxidoreductase family protein [Novosphingobium sp.]
MKAWLSRDPGPADTMELVEIDAPQPAAGELQVAVSAVSLNYPDALMLEDLYQTKPPRPFVPGTEFSGTVTALGEGVTSFNLGDRVVCIANGGLGETTVCKAAMAVKLPDAVPFDVGATLMMTYGTNIHALLDRVHLKAGETMLVLGAGGGIGMAAVELGKALGARVVAAVSSPEKRDAVLAIGADEYVIYPRGDLDKAASRELANQFKAACPKGYDVIYDPVGGDYAEPAIRSIGWEGRYAVIGFTAGIPKMPLNLTLLKCCQVIGVFWGAWAMLNQDKYREEMQLIFDFVAEGKLKPLISENFAFEDAPKALARMRGRGAVGKLVVTVAD